MGEGGGALPNEYRNIARVNLEAAKQKLEGGRLYRTQKTIRWMHKKIGSITGGGEGGRAGREITIRKVTQGTASHSNTDIKIHFGGFFP